METTTIPSGEDQHTGGKLVDDKNFSNNPATKEVSPEDASNSNEDKEKLKTDFVAYDTHRKLLTEKKKLQERLREFESEDQKRREDELLKQQNYKALLENRDEELNKTRGKLQELESQFNNSRKLDSFLNSLGGNVEAKYWSLIDLDKIIFDPETNIIDDMSVTKLVEDFRKEHSRLIDTKDNSPKLPTSAPASPNGLDKNVTLKDKLNTLGEILSKN